MDFQESSEPAPEVQRWFAAHQTSAEVADAVIASFEEIASALSPILGVRGVAALIGRSIHLGTMRHPWLRVDGEAFSQTVDFLALRQAIVQREAGDAATGASDLLNTFRTLLSTLIGASLTGKLLHPAWTRFSNETDAKKASS